MHIHYPVKQPLSGHPLTKAPGCLFEVPFEGFAEGGLGLIAGGQGNSAHGLMTLLEPLGGVLQTHACEICLR